MVQSIGFSGCPTQGQFTAKTTKNDSTLDYKLSHINALCINLLYLLKNESLKGVSSLPK